MKNGSTGFMRFFGRPLVDEIRMGQVVQVNYVRRVIEGCDIDLFNSFCTRSSLSGSTYSRPNFSREPLTDVDLSTRAEVDYQQIIHKKERDLWMNPEELDFRISMDWGRQSTGVNSWRGGRYVGQTSPALYGMPLVCGDALYEHDADSTSERDQIESSLIQHMNGAPLIGM